MYRRFTIIKIIALLLLLTCPHSFAYAQNASNVSVDKQSFEGEDLLILQALDAQQRGEYNSSASLYKKLYEKSGRDEYLKSSIRLFLASDNMSSVGDLIQIGLKTYPEDFDYERFSIAKLLKEDNISAAKDEALALIEKENNEQNLRLIGAIYMYLQDYNSALKYFDSAYTFSRNEQIMLQIADVYMKLGKTDEAIAQLETYTRLNGCVANSCHKLLEIYNKQKDLNGLLSVYKRLYDASFEDEYAQKIVEIFMFQNRRDEAMKFLEESGYKPDILMEMYIVEKQFDKAMALAKKMYDETGELEYLSKMAVVEYESAEKKTAEIIGSVSEKFEKSLNNESEPLYLNYYGYLLIDHDLNVAKGMELVEKALKGEPDSPYYQDSLAWGFYKQKKCAEAYSIMQKVTEKLNDKEILDHLKLIKSCLNEKTEKTQK